MKDRYTTFCGIQLIDENHLISDSDSPMTRCEPCFAGWRKSNQGTVKVVAIKQMMHLVNAR